MRTQILAAMALVSATLAVPGIALGAVGDSAESKALQEVKSGKAAKVGPWLAALHEEYKNSQRGKNKGAAFETRLPAVIVRDNRVRVEGVANDAAELRSTLEAMGANDILQVGTLFSANVPIAALGELGAAPSLRFAGPVAAKTREASQGAVVGQGDLAINAPAAREFEDVDGTGVRVGILSDSFGCDTVVFFPGAPNPRSADDIANQDVDPDILILDDGCPGGSDEGRGMANLVKDVAPGAPQAFHTAFNSRLDFALGILELGGIETGWIDFGFYVPTTGDDVSDVIVDDVIYFVEPMFSPGQIAQAANTVAEAGIPYFSSAGNNARNSYEADFDGTVRTGNNGRNLNSGAAPGPNATLRHDFDPGPGVDDTQTITVFPDASGLGVTVFSFQWDEPHASSTAFANIADGDFFTPPVGSASDVDFLFYDRNGILVPFCPAVGLAVGITCQLTGVNNIGGDAVEFAALIYNAPSGLGPVPEQFQISIVVSGGPEPGRVKYVPFDFNGTVLINEWDTQSGTAYGHSNGEHVASVAAAAFYFTGAFDGDPAITSRIPLGTCTTDSAACLEDFSSAGEIPIFFDKYGNRLDNAITPDNPRFTGVDGSNTSFFAFDSSFDDDDGDGANSPFSTFVTPTLDDPADEIPNFFGTSASAPNVAAVAALMLQKNPALSAEDVYDILSDTALPVSLREAGYDPTLQTISIPDEPGIPEFNYDSGHGLVDAAAAVGAATAP